MNRILKGWVLIAAFLVTALMGSPASRLWASTEGAYLYHLLSVSGIGYFFPTTAGEAIVGVSVSSTSAQDHGIVISSNTNTTYISSITANSFQIGGLFTTTQISTLPGYKGQMVMNVTNYALCVGTGTKQSDANGAWVYLSTTSAALMSPRACGGS